jgi:hypothetical protein
MDRAGPDGERAGPDGDGPDMSSPPESRLEERSRSAPSSRRSPFLWWAPILLLSLAGVLIATFSDNPSHPARTTATSPSGSAAREIKLRGGGLRIGRTIGLSSVAGSVSIGSRNVWVSLPNRGELSRSTL